MVISASRTHRQEDCHGQDEHDDYASDHRHTGTAHNVDWALLDGAGDDHHHSGDRLDSAQQIASETHRDGHSEHIDTSSSGQRNHERNHREEQCGTGTGE